MGFWEQAQGVTSKGTFLQFMSALLEDWKQRHELTTREDGATIQITGTPWKNSYCPDFLQAMRAWIADATDLPSGVSYQQLAAIMAAAAGTLYKEGLGLTEPSQMITLLEPLAGKFATAIFAFGIIAAGVSSQFPNVLMLPWLLCDYNNTERKMTLAKYRMMVLVISMLGLVVPIFHARPVFVMIISQAFNSIILPVTIACILYLGNRKDLMGKYKNSIGTNIFLIAVLIFSISTSTMGIKGVLQLITSQ